MTPTQRQIIRKLRKLGWKVEVVSGRKHDKLHVLVKGKILKFPMASTPSAGWEAQLKALRRQVKQAAVDI
jgi:hypothetical protein